MDLRHQSSAMCITMLGEDTHPRSATKVGNPIPATIPVDQLQKEKNQQTTHTSHGAGTFRHQTFGRQKFKPISATIMSPNCPIQGSKNSKRLPIVKYSLLQYSKIENFSKFFFRNYIFKKMDRVARRGPLARAPGALKEGHVRNCQHFCRRWRGDPSEKKQIFEKNLNAQKTEREPFGILNTHSVVKYQRNWRGTLWREKILGKKSHNAEKLKRGTLWGFSTSILSQNIKKIEGGKIFFSEKNLTVPKKL